ncbi:42109_t:CDS:2, partial [Gigaspora margarita]
NIQNNDNKDNNNASSSSKSSRSQNQNEMDNASTSHIATNILDILPEDNIGDNDDTISSNEYEEEFQSGISGKQRNHEVSQIPAEFGGMNNILKICNWLVKNPSILQLANQSIWYPYYQSKILDSARIWDEKIKCLFLRARFPLATCIDEFVKKIFGYSPYSKEGTEIRTKTKNTL